jgi:predicted MFS family arabinose efflux permease
VRSERRAVTALFALLGGTFGTFAARIPAVQDAAGLSDAALGVALAGLVGGALAGMAAGGAVVGRTGSRRLLGAGVAAFAAVLALLPWVSGTARLTVALALFGLANSLVDVGANAQAAWVERRWPRSVLASFHAAFSLAALVAAGVAAVVAGAGVGVRAHFAAVALAGGACGAVALRWVTAEPGAPGPRAAALALPGRALALPAAVAGCALLAEDVANTWAAVFLRAEAGAGPGLAAAGFALYAAGTLAGRLVADRVVDARGGRWTLAAGGGAAAAGGGLLAAVPRPAAAAAGLLLLGAGLAPVLPVLVGVAARTDTARSGSAIAAVTLAGYAGSAVGPPLVGVLAEVIGLRAAFAVVPAAALAAALLALGLDRPVVAPGGARSGGVAPRPTEGA